MNRENEPDHVTIRELYKMLTPVHSRLRRLEYTVVGLMVATASPKLGGPAASDVVSGCIHLLS